MSGFTIVVSFMLLLYPISINYSWLNGKWE